MEQTESNSKLMLVGAMKSMVNNVIEAVKGAGLIAQAIDLNCFSLFRTIDEVYNLGKNKETLCAVYLGSDISIIEIIQGNTLKFPRFLSNSLSTFVDNIEKSTGTEKEISWDHINNFDFKVLVMDKSDQKKAAGDTEKKEELPVEDENIIKSISATADNLVNEIRMSIEHFLQENAKVRIEKILLSGENLKNIEKYIQYKTDYKVERLNISEGFSLEIMNKNTDMSQILNPLAIGMALRGIKK